jgi:hypothetical protein
MTGNEGEKRESLNILEKVGMYEGLLDKICTDKMTGIVGDKKDIKRRQSFFGVNTKQMPQLKTFWQLLREQAREKMI